MFRRLKSLFSRPRQFAFDVYDGERLLGSVSAASQVEAERIAAQRYPWPAAAGRLVVVESLATAW